MTLFDSYIVTKFEGIYIFLYIRFCLGKTEQTNLGTVVFLSGAQACALMISGAAAGWGESSK